MTMRALMSQLLWAMIFAHPVFAGGQGTLQGIVSAGRGGQAGVSIELYLESRKAAGGAPFALTESLEGGRFELELPAGTYYLWARGKAPSFGPPLVTEYSANPVKVSAGMRTTLLPLVLREAGRESVAVAPKETGIKGRVTVERSPADEVTVTVYDAVAANLTGPGYAASTVTGPDGLFQIDLPPGKYRAAARKRLGGGTAGFLRPGDLTAEFAGNPVTVIEGRYTDIGEVRLHTVDLQRLQEKERERRAGSSPTRLRGRTTGADGKPLAGQYVFAYRDQGMIGRPEVMVVSGSDGLFTFDLPGGGTWHLGARSTMGGPRQPGEMAGRLTGSPDSSVALEPGTEKGGLEIRMEMVW